MSYDVRDKTILVTGANRGIGKAITNTLLKHGAGKIYAAVRRPASADALVESHGVRQRLEAYAAIAILSGGRGGRVGRRVHARGR